MCLVASGVFVIFFSAQPLALQSMAGYENACGVSDHYGTVLMLTPRSNFHVVAARSDWTDPTCLTSHTASLQSQSAGNRSYQRQGRLLTCGSNIPGSLEKSSSWQRARSTLSQSQSFSSESNQSQSFIYAKIIVPGVMRYFFLRNPVLTRSDL